jgi:peptidoglycan/xylan/chitin deacetylase (PgdA/CDA1 family)
MVKAKIKQSRKAQTINKKRKKKFLVEVLVICTLLGLGSFFIYFYTNSSYKPVVELPKTEMKKVPTEFKKQLQHATSSATFRVPVLMYHYVEYVQDKRDTIRQSLDILPIVFDEQMKTLSDAGYTFMTAKELSEVIDGKRILPLHPILITIDDGHWDLDTDILPILKKYHVKATAYIIPGFLGGSDFLTKDQLQDVINSGLVEIGAHTVHHLWLKGRPLSVVQSEVNDSKKMLEELYHLPIVSFAYPSGAFDEQTIAVVKQAGFNTAMSTIPGIEQNNANRFFLYILRPR